MVPLNANFARSFLSGRSFSSNDRISVRSEIKISVFPIVTLVSGKTDGKRCSPTNQEAKLERSMSSTIFSDEYQIGQFLSCRCWNPP